MTDNRAQLNVKLQKYFTDFACTQLRSTYQSISDEALKSVLTTDQMPQSLIDMVLRVKQISGIKEILKRISFENASVFKTIKPIAIHKNGLMT